MLTRERLPAEQLLQKAYGVLDKFRINRAFFVKTDQEGCALAASDINAAQGITSVSTVVEQTGEEQRQQAPKDKIVKMGEAEESQNAAAEAEAEDAEEVKKNKGVKTVAELIQENAAIDDAENDAVVVKAATCEKAKSKKH